METPDNKVRVQPSKEVKILSCRNTKIWQSLRFPLGLMARFADALPVDALNFMRNDEMLNELNILHLELCQQQWIKGESWDPGPHWQNLGQAPWWWLRDNLDT